MRLSAPQGVALHQHRKEKRYWWRPRRKSSMRPPRRSVKWQKTNPWRSDKAELFCGEVPSGPTLLLPDHVCGPCVVPRVE